MGISFLSSHPACSVFGALHGRHFLRDSSGRTLLLRPCGFPLFIMRFLLTPITLRASQEGTGSAAYLALSRYPVRVCMSCSSSGRASPEVLPLPCRCVQPRPLSCQSNPVSEKRSNSACGKTKWGSSSPFPRSFCLLMCQALGGQPPHSSPLHIWGLRARGPSLVPLFRVWVSCCPQHEAAGGFLPTHTWDSCCL